MIKKFFIVVLLFFLFTPPFVSCGEYVLHQVPSCLGNISIQDRSGGGDYSFRGCVSVSGGFVCDCVGGDIVLLYDEFSPRSYSFFVEYFLGEDNDSLRFYSYEGLSLGREKAFSDVVSELSLGFKVFVVTFLIFLGLLFVLLFVWLRGVFKDDDGLDDSDVEFLRRVEKT